MAGAAGCFEEFHSCFVGCAIAFFGIALNTRRREVLPRIHATARLWLNMVNRQWWFHGSTILAAVRIAAHDVFA